MKESATVTLILTILIQITGTVGQNSKFLPNFSSNCDLRERDFFLLSKSLSSGLNFFKENVDQLVLDAAVGTRILERQVGLILDSNSNLSEPLQTFLVKLIKLSKGVSERIVKINTNNSTSEQGNSNYLMLHDSLSLVSDILAWVTTPELWKTPLIGSWSQLVLDKRETKLTFDMFLNETEILDEDTSDECIGQLFQNCDLSSTCQTLFLKGPYSKYSLTHQVIFLHIAKQLSCFQRSNFPVMDWSTYGRTLCLKVLDESKVIETEGFPEKFQDLFSEQMAVCSMSGYHDFLRINWLYQILLWQKQLTTRTACFLYHDDKVEIPKRQKRSEVIIDFELKKCSIHFSAVGMAAVAMNLRYFLETCVVF